MARETACDTGRRIRTRARGSAIDANRSRHHGQPCTERGARDLARRPPGNLQLARRSRQPFGGKGTPDDDEATRNPVWFEAALKAFFARIEHLGSWLGPDSMVPRRTAPGIHPRVHVRRPSFTDGGYGGSFCPSLSMPTSNQGVLRTVPTARVGLRPEAASDATRSM